LIYKLTGHYVVDIINTVTKTNRRTTMIYANIQSTFLLELETEGLVSIDDALEIAEENFVFALDDFDGFNADQNVKVTEIHVQSNRKEALITFTAKDLGFVDLDEVDWVLENDICDTIVITEDDTPDQDDWDGIGDSTMNKHGTGCK